MTSELRISLLGPVSIKLGGKPLDGLTSIKARALLIYLAVTEHPQSRVKLAGLLWPDVLESSARSSLRTTLMRLRKSIDGYLANGEDSVEIEPNLPLWLDVRDFESACDKLKAHNSLFTDHERQLLRQAVYLYREDFLADFHLPDAPIFEEWVLQQREYYRRQALEAFYSLAVAALARDNYVEAIEDALRITALDSANEAAHTLLMRVYALNGQTSQALRQFHELVKILKSELDVSPSLESTALYEKIKEGSFLPTARTAGSDSRLAPSLTERSGPPTSDPKTHNPHNLPRQTTPFVGHEQELSQIRKRLADPSVRLLTIVGLGGMGKTRLAIEAASREVNRFADGVWFVTLAAVANPALVASTIALTLNLPDDGGGDPELHLVRHLADKQMLIILDNMEHLLDTSGLATRILDEAPRVQVIVTSRERLRLQEEWLLPLAGLEVPRLDELTAFDPVAHGAVELFVQHARRLSPSFAETPANMAQIIQICRLVGGMPLGIELAASWLRTIPLAEIAGEVQAGIDFLTTSLRDVPLLHRSMRAVFDRSWLLLDEREQWTLAALSLFRGGFTRDAAEKIAGATVSILAHLVDSSWVQLTANERYDLHELVRQYVAEKLEAMTGEAGHLQKLHAGYFGALAEHQTALMGTVQQKNALGTLMNDIDNIRSGWQWAVIHLDTTLIGHYAECLKWLANTRSLYREVLPELTRASNALRAAAVAESSLPRDRRENSFALGLLLYQQAFLRARSVTTKAVLPQAKEALELLRPTDFEQTDEHKRRFYLQALHAMCYAARNNADFDQAVDGCRELMRLAASRPQYQTYVGMAVGFRAKIANDQGRFDEARLLFAESMTYAGGDDSARLYTRFPLSIAELHLDTGDLDEAVRMLAIAEDAIEQTGSSTENKNVLYYWACIAMWRGEIDQAQKLLEQVGGLANETAVVHARWLYLIGRGELARFSGQTSEAQHFYIEAVEHSEREGRRHHRVKALLGLSFALLDQGAFAKARESFIRTLQAAQEIGVMPQVVGAIVGLAALRAHDGDREQAVEWLTVAVNHPACLYTTKLDAEAILARQNLDLASDRKGYPHQQSPETALRQIIAEFAATPG